MIRCPPGIAGFDVIVENEEELLDPDTRYKVEVLAIGENGNKTTAERDFVTGS